MPEQNPSKSISWPKVILTVLIIVLVAGAISGSLFWYFCVRQSEEPTAAITTKTATSSANKKEKVTLKINELETTYGVEGDKVSGPPKSIEVTIPSGYADKLAAYFAADLVVVAPANWTGQGLLAANGSKGIDLHPLSSEERGKISVGISSPGLGSTLSNAGDYFPWIQSHWQELGMSAVPVPESPRGIKRTFISDYLIKYTLPETAEGLEVKGVAYSDAQSVKDHFGSFENLEVSLPPSQHDLAIVILDTFISIRGLK